MAKKKKKFKLESDESGFVFSTNPDFVPPSPDDSDEDDSAGKTTLYLWLEKQGRGGKTATIIRGHEGNDLELKLFASQIKSALSTGGSVKDGEIILQGDVRDKLGAWLDKEGWKWKKAGG